MAYRGELKDRRKISIPSNDHRSMTWVFSRLALSYPVYASNLLCSLFRCAQDSELAFSKYSTSQNTRYNFALHHRSCRRLWLKDSVHDYV